MNDVSNVLSKEKQLILVTFYKYGMDGISFDKSYICFKRNGCFAGTLNFDSEPFDFTEILEYMELRHTYSLSSIIENFCPEYKDIIKR